MYHFFDIFIVIMAVVIAGALLIKRFMQIFDKTKEGSPCVGCSNSDCPYKDKDLNQ
ncbi:hypothetical protein JCM13304A_08070 [Desulfothermus okinawensis JCM 13304]